MVLCYSASNETDISNVRFSYSLLTLPSIRSSGHINHVRWLLVHLLFSRQQTRYAPSRNPYHRLWVSSHPRRHAHRSRLLIATRYRWCGATAANHAESSIASQPQSATLAESSTNARIMG